MRTALIALAAFLVGFGWQYVRARGVERQLAAVTRDADLARLEAALGRAAVEAQRGAYELARQQASNFYVRAQRAVTRQLTATPRGGAPTDALPAPEQALRRVLQGRDATITLLSRNDPQAADVLVRSLVEYRTALRGAPAPAGARPPR